MVIGSTRLGRLMSAGAGLALPALLVSACGSGGHSASVAHLGLAAGTATRSSTSSSTDKFASALAYSRCMRSHGVPGYADPQQVGHSIQISGSRSGLNPASRTFTAAQTSCRQLLPGGGGPSRGEQQRDLTRMLRTSRCMRKHGISGFPDPTLGPPADRAGYSEIMSNGVAWLAIPGSIDPRSPVFRHAAAACDLNVG